MRLRFHQIVVGLDFTEADIVREIARRLACREEDLSAIATVRRSLDARHRDRPPRYVLTVEADYQGTAVTAISTGGVDEVNRGLTDRRSTRPRSRFRSRSPARKRPVVIGAGPAGLMAALALSEAGLGPMLFERGSAAQKRTLEVDAFWRQGVLNLESNVLYGEGGAGLFSDGKLTTRIKDRANIRHFLQVLVDCGASPEIMVDAEPHLGSDVLAGIIPRLRDRIQDQGGSVTFGARLESLHIDGGSVRGVTISGKQITTDACFLGTGHSARDVYEMLVSAGIPLEPKPFAMGVRVEIPQHRINTAQYGRFADHPRLGSASFRLTRASERGARSCYSFCMCPGGTVIPCASSDEMLTTNGMSRSDRGRPFGNAAFLVPVRPADFAGSEEDEALSGIEFQKRWERAAYDAGGGGFALPAQPLTAFIQGKCPNELPEARSCARAASADLRGVLPSFVADTLRVAVPKMVRDLRGTKIEEVLLYAAETRSSSPVRILRSAESGQSIGACGLYPIGEGAGYAGGIVSSGVDGLRAAEHLLRS